MSVKVSLFLPKLVQPRARSVLSLLFALFYDFVYVGAEGRGSVVGDAKYKCLVCVWYSGVVWVCIGAPLSSLLEVYM